MRLPLAIGGAVLLLLVARPAAAAVVPVSDVAGLRAALEAAKPGDEIVLAAGDYAVSGANLACRANGTAEAPIVVRSAAPLAAKLTLTTLEGFLVTGAHWHFEGLDIRGTCASDDDCEHAFHVAGASGFVLRNSRLADFNAQLKVNATAGGTSIPHRGLVEGNELFDSHPRRTDRPITKLNIDTGEGWIVRANLIHDFHRTPSGSATYGAFMKSGGKDGLFERNLVLCTKDDPSAGTHIGLSFGGGGTAPVSCAPAFDARVECAVEHENGTMRNNIVANCSDVGIYVNKGRGTKLLHNTVIATLGIDFRFLASTGEARGNVLGNAIRDREQATHADADNLTNVATATFEAMYVAPLSGDLRKKGDLSALLGKVAANTAVAEDYCARTRTGSWDLGALQHSLGDCETTRPPVKPPPGSSGGLDGGSSEGGAAGTSGGTSGASGGTSGTSGSTSGTSGSTGGPSGAATSGGANAASEDGCGCRSVGAAGGHGWLALGAIAVGGALARRRRRRH